MPTILVCRSSGIATTSIMRRIPREVLSARFWYHTGLPPVPIRWVLVRDPKGRFETRALLCTQLDQQPRQILQWFLWRWQVEITFPHVL
jgi:hypothetical protein